VRISFVTGLPHADYGQEVASAIVPEHGQAINIDRIMKRTRLRISPFKEPTMTAVIDEASIPHLGSSKANGRAPPPSWLTREDRDRNRMRQ
jgi:hypothetical protein